ncbi:MAG: sulfurtransferase [Gammaproteobacteria bacterium]|nr:sulfurtransferase [Gammaproteobacteria bacterium]
MAGHLNDPDLRIFECTTYLDYLPPGSDAPYRVMSGRADYEAGHVPGAGFADIQNDLSDAGSPPHLRFTLPSPVDLAARFGRLGIGDEHRVVLYSRGRLVWATRVWWMLRAVGFDNAAILDGGFEKWIAEDRPVSAQPSAFPPATLTPRPRKDVFVDKHKVLETLGRPDACLVNALEPELHRGENPRYGRPGRIPGSVNVPSSSLVAPATLSLLPPADANSKFREAGVDPSGPALVYCGGGIAATLDAFVLYQLGCDAISIYDASMSEWARDESLPIETG